MYHTIEFATDLLVDLDISPKQPLERMQARAGTRHRVQVRPHVIETPAGPVEAADLYFDDGTAARSVPFASFSFAN